MTKETVKALSCGVIAGLASLVTYELAYSLGKDRERNETGYVLARMYRAGRIKFGETINGVFTEMSPGDLADKLERECK